jgi:hypothetical protein
LFDGISTDWEISTSTGRDPMSSFTKFKAGKVFTEMTASINSNLSELQGLRDSMQTAPKGMEAAATSLSEAVDALYNYLGAIQQYGGNPAPAAFRATLQEYSNKVNASLATIQAIPAPPGEAPPAPQEQPQTEQPQTEQPNSNEQQRY